MAAHEPVLKLIIAWKWGRAGLSLLGSAALGVLLLAGLRGPLRDWASGLHRHAVSGLALALSQLFSSAVESNHIVTVALALLLDGVVLVVEGWALWNGHRWGAWLVVGATALLLPFEVVALFRHVSLSRLLLLAVNLVIVAWLVLRRLRHQQGSSE